MTTLSQLIAAVERAGTDNALDVQVEIALFRPNTVYSAIRANAAGTKVIYTDRVGNEVTCWPEDWTRPARRESTLAALRAHEARAASDDLLKLEVAFLVSLAQDNIAPDTQELLVHGNPLRGIKPGALGRALAGPLAEIRRLREEVEGARATLTKIAADSFGLQGIIEDYGHDTNALNYREALYWKAETGWRRNCARAALGRIGEE